MIEADKKPLLDIKSEEDPEIPWTGGTSATFQNDHLAEAAIREDAEKKQRQRNELLPVANDIFGFINSERAAIADIRAYIKTLGEHPASEELMAEYRARELYLSYLMRFEGWMTNRLQKTTARRPR